MSAAAAVVPAHFCRPNHSNSEQLHPQTQQLNQSHLSATSKHDRKQNTGMHEHAASSGAQAGPAQRPRFKVVASVVMAMRRFQGVRRLVGRALAQACASPPGGHTPHHALCARLAASLNPTYSYGKRQSDSGAETVVSCLLSLAASGAASGAGQASAERY